MHGEITQNDDDVAEFGSILDNPSKDGGRWRAFRLLREEVEDVLEEVKEGPQADDPRHFQTYIETILHLANPVDRHDVTHEEQPID